MEKQHDPKIIRSNVLSMVVPITFENILQMAAGVVSMAFVGRINALAIGAIGLSNILFRISLNDLFINVCGKPNNAVTPR